MQVYDADELIAHQMGMHPGVGLSVSEPTTVASKPTLDQTESFDTSLSSRLFGKAKKKPHRKRKPSKQSKAPGVDASDEVVHV